MATKLALTDVSPNRIGKSNTSSGPTRRLVQMIMNGHRPLRAKCPLMSFRSFPQTVSLSSTMLILTILLRPDDKHES